MFGRPPNIPLDHLIDTNWDDEFVAEQAEMMDRVWEVAQSCLEQAASASKARYDKKNVSESFDVGTRVLLQATGFKTRHKLADHYLQDAFVVISRNPAGNHYEIRPSLGGAAKWVNRKLLIKDPRCDLDPGVKAGEWETLGKDSESDEASSNEDNDLLFGLKYDPPPDLGEHDYVPHEVELDAQLEAGVQPTGEDLSDDDEMPNIRRSARVNKGAHGNPFREPRSALS
jgi:hypothetical protein